VAPFRTRNPEPGAQRRENFVTGGLVMPNQRAGILTAQLRLRGRPEPARRVVRGGAWNNTIDNCRASYRNRNTPDNRNNNLGFRLVASGHIPGAHGRRCGLVTAGPPSSGCRNGAGRSRLLGQAAAAVQPGGRIPPRAASRGRRAPGAARLHGQ
jgi:hypothetical protein